jgi:hypothetical protein
MNATMSGVFGLGRKTSRGSLSCRYHISDRISPLHLQFQLQQIPRDDLISLRQQLPHVPAHAHIPIRQPGRTLVVAESA